MQILKKCLILLASMSIGASYAFRLNLDDNVMLNTTETNSNGKLTYGIDDKGRRGFSSDGYLSIHSLLSTIVNGCVVDIPLSLEVDGVPLEDGEFLFYQGIEMNSDAVSPGINIVNRDNDSELWFNCNGKQYQYRLDYGGNKPEFNRAYLHLYDENGDPVNNADTVLPVGSYQQTCKNYTYTEAGKLEADCYKQYGYTNHSTLNYRNMCLLRSLVSNNNGVLTCDSPAPAGSYRQTCLDPSVNMATGYILFATCPNKIGQYKQTSLNNFQQCEWGINNVDGQLVCARPPKAAMSAVAKSGVGVVWTKDTSSQLHAQSVKPW